MPPSRLGERERVYALTVHTSHGFKSDHATLVLPDEPNAVLTRELLYTRITRARRWFSLRAAMPFAEQTVDQPVRRHSGLHEHERVIA